MASVTLSSKIKANAGFHTQTGLANGYKTSQDSQIWIERSGTNTAGSEIDQAYTLEIYGDAAAGYDLTSFDINLNYNTDDWHVVDVTSAKLNIDENFKFFNSAEFKDTDSYRDGALRVVGGSADNLNGGVGVEDGVDGLLFSVHFTAKDVLNATTSGPYSTAVGQYSDTTAFSWSVNENDTIVRDSTTSGAGVTLKTAELDGETGVSYTMTELLSDVEYTTSNLSFVTDQVIGTSAKTSLVREGSTLISDGSLNYENTGLADAFTAGKASLTADTNVAGVDISLVTTSDTITEFVKDGTTDAEAQVVQQKDGLQLQMTVTGTAGDVIDYMESAPEGEVGDSRVNIERTMSNGETVTSDNTDITIAKNLVTYKADINYDGRVSMMDLATLNAAAKASTDNPELDLSSVNVNNDTQGLINIQDLVAMDAQWGSSLHSSEMTGDIFTGTNGAK